MKSAGWLLISTYTAMHTYLSIIFIINHVTQTYAVKLLTKMYRFLIKPVSITVCWHDFNIIGA